MDFLPVSEAVAGLVMAILGYFFGKKNGKKQKG